MAKKVYIDFELRYKEAVANLDEMQKEYTKLEKKVEKYDDAVQESSESAKEMGGVLDSVTGGAITKFKGLTSTVGNVIKGFKSLRVAIIATGIGALALAIGAVISAFTRSEKGQDRFAKILGVIQAVIGELMDRLADFGELIINVFSEPGKIWQGFVDIMKAGYDRIKLQVIDRFKANFTLLVGGIQKGILKMRIAWNKFTGDSVEAEKLTNQLDKVNAKMDEARETIKKANTSLKDDFNEISRLVASGREDLADYLEDIRRNIEEESRMAQKRADIISAANKQERQLIVERAKADREIAAFREQAADKENISVQDRIKAIEAAGKIEEQITNKEISLAAKRLEAKRIENEMGKSTREDKEEEARLTARLIELETARLRKQKALTAEITTALREEQAERNAILAEQKAKEAEEEKLRKEKQAEEDAAELERQKNLEQEKQKIREKALADQKAVADAELTIKNAALSAATSGFQILAGFDKKNKKLQAAMLIATNAVGIAQNIINTNAANARLTLEAGIGAPALILANKIRMFTGIAASVAATAQGLSALKEGGNPKTVTPRGMGGGEMASQAPAFNVVGASETNQLASAIGEQQQQPVQAFVVSNDVTTAQELDRNIIQGATIG